MRLLTFAICLAGVSFVGEAQAGLGLFKHRAVPVTSVGGTSVASGSTCATCGASTGGAGSTTGYVNQTGSAGGFPPAPTRPYSYYAAPNGDARGYYGYGEDAFPYYGRAYGHPYDPWTWPYMSYGYQNSLNRYYEPPVR